MIKANMNDALFSELTKAVSEPFSSELSNQIFAFENIIWRNHVQAPKLPQNVKGITSIFAHFKPLTWLVLQFPVEWEIKQVGSS